MLELKTGNNFTVTRMLKLSGTLSIFSKLADDVDRYVIPREVLCSRRPNSINSTLTPYYVDILSSKIKRTFLRCIIRNNGLTFTDTKLFGIGF